MASTDEFSKFSASFPDRKLNFLLVDDDTICQFINSRVLELSGYCNSGQAALNGKEALDVLRKAAAGSLPLPDVILLDLEMPLMNGLEFLKAFHDLEEINQGRMAVVLLSSSESPEDRRQAMAMGVFHCMSKPLTNEKLDDLVNMLYPDRMVVTIAQHSDPSSNIRMRS